MLVTEREDYANAVSSELTECDVKILNDRGFCDTKRAMLAVEHASRAQALLNSIDDQMHAGRIYLMLSSKFLRFGQERAQ